jgi:hypothetical protein
VKSSDRIYSHKTRWILWYASSPITIKGLSLDNP